MTNNPTRPPNHPPLRRRPSASLVSLLILITALAPGCTSPPSAAPLLRLVAQALDDEAAQLAADALIRQRHAQETRATLAAAYEADLTHQPALNPQWVLDATRAYVAAHEAVVRQELADLARCQQRIDNLRDAGEAQRRAIALIEKQDQLITQTTGLDAWRMTFTNPLKQENK